MAIDSELARQMDTAAEAAKKELKGIMTEPRPTETYEEAFVSLAGWWKRYYLMAGHKRLGKVLLGLL